MRRLLTALFGIPLVLACVFWGGWIFFLFVAICIVMMIVEFRKMFKYPINDFGFIFVLFCAGALIVGRFVGNGNYLLIVFVLLILLVMLVNVFGKRNSGMLLLAVDFISVFYVALMFSFLIDVRNMEQGITNIFLLFAIVWIYDSAAYFLGIRYGKHKMAPVLSPKKSWEGLIFGLATTFVVLQVVNYVHHVMPWALWGAVVLAVAVAAQLGDLIESYLKRQAGVKDSGSFLPGHGGFLDRFDSFLLATPVFFILLSVIG